MSGVIGLQAHFSLAGPTQNPIIPEQDMSRWLKSIAKAGDTDSIDVTTFQAASREEVGGFATKTFTLTGNWSKAAHQFLSPLDTSKPQGLTYEYGPEGEGSGKLQITGLCNFKSYVGPVDTTVDGVIEFTVELGITSETHSITP
jgi:hypothetical protein